MSPRRSAALVALLMVVVAATLLPRWSARAASAAPAPPMLLTASVATTTSGQDAPPTPVMGPQPTPTPALSPLPSPSASPSDAGPCGISPILSAFCSVGHAIQSAPGAVVGGIASGIGDSIIGAVTRWVADGAAWVLKQVTDLIDGSTTPDLNAQWFRSNYATMATLAGVLLAIFLFFATVQGLIGNRPSMILRAYLLHAPIAAIGTVLAIALVSRGLQATDAMSSAVSVHMHHDVARIAERVGIAVRVASRVTGDGSLFLAFLGALLAVVVAVILWLELLIREAAIDVCVLFLPLVLAAFVWPSTARWLRRLINTLADVVLSKFVIVAVLALSAAALADNMNDGGIKAILVGVVLLILAAICPYLVFRLLPGVELAISGRWFSGGMRAASRRAPVPTGGGRGPRGGGWLPRTASSGLTVAAWAGPAAAAAATAARVGQRAAATVRDAAQKTRATTPRSGMRTSPSVATSTEQKRAPSRPPTPRPEGKDKEHADG